MHKAISHCTNIVRYNKVLSQQWLENESLLTSCLEMKETLNEFIDKIDVMLWESLPYNTHALKTSMNILWYHNAIINNSKFNIVLPFITYNFKLTYYTQDLKNSQGSYISILISKKQVLDEFHFSQERKINGN